jgi:hypothetical protein
MASKRKPNGLVQIIRDLGSIKLAIFSAIGIVVLLAVLPWLLRLYIDYTGAAEVSGDPGLALEGTISLVTLALILGGGVFALTEYLEGEEDRKDRERQSSLLRSQDIVERMNTKADIEARRWVIRNIPVAEENESAQDHALRARAIVLPPDEPRPTVGQGYVKHVLNTFDYLGIVEQNYGEFEDHIMRWISPMVTKVWERIGDYIEDEASRRNEPDYYLWARQLGWACIDWRKGQNYPDAQFVDDAL